jgi:hypothetical protein
MFYRPAGGKATPEQMDAVEKAADEAINQLETATDLIARNWPAIVELYRDRKEIKPLQLLLQNRDFYEKKMRAAWMQLGYSTETIMNGTALWPSKYGEVRFYVDAEDTAQKDAAYVYAIGVPWIGRTPLTGAVIHLLPEFFRNPKRQPYYLIHEMGRLQGLLYANYDYSPGNTANIYNVEMFDELVAILSNPAVVKAVEERSAQIRQRRGPTKGM